MAEIHSIHLRGPWTISSSEKSVTYAHPCCWAEAGFSHYSGTLRHLRSFGKPTGIEDCRLFLHFEKIQEQGSVYLNGELIASDWRSGSIEITNKLLPRNLLLVEVTSSTDQGGIIGFVRLDIVSEKQSVY
jgi:hypothetical protein